MYYLYIFIILNIVYKDSKWYTCLTSNDIFHMDARHMAYMVFAIFSIIYKYDILYFTSNILCIYIYITCKIYASYFVDIYLTNHLYITMLYFLVKTHQIVSPHTSFFVIFWETIFLRTWFWKSNSHCLAPSKPCRVVAASQGWAPLVLRDQCRRCGRKTEVLERSTIHEDESNIFIPTRNYVLQQISNHHLLQPLFWFWILQFGLCSRSCWQHVTTLSRRLQASQICERSSCRRRCFYAWRPLGQASCLVVPCCPQIQLDSVA